MRGCTDGGSGEAKGQEGGGNDKRIAAGVRGALLGPHAESDDSSLLEGGDRGGRP